MLTPRIIVDAMAEPISFDDIVEHSRIPYDQQQPLVEKYIRAARMACENDIDGSISPRTLEIVLDRFPSCRFVGLPQGPVDLIVSVKYIDTDGLEQTYADTNYVLDRYGRAQALRLAYGASWPTARCQFDAVRIRYTVGYAFNDSPPTAVPEPILQAIRLQVDHMYENRSAVDASNLAELPLGVKRLLDPYRQNLGV